jgi:putative effector of murein hydrolase
LIYKKPIDADEFDAVEEIRKSQVETNIGNFERSSNVESDVEMFGISEHSKAAQEDLETVNPMANRTPFSSNTDDDTERFSQARPTSPAIKRQTLSRKSEAVSRQTHVSGKVNKEQLLHVTHPNAFSKYTEVDDALRDLGISFALMNENHSNQQSPTIEDLDTLTIERASCIRKEVRLTQAHAKTTGHLSQHLPDKEPPSAEPFLPNMNQLLLFWFVLSIITGFMLLVASLASASNVQHYVITFQFSATIMVFIGCLVFRANLKKRQYMTLLTIFQSVILFFPIMLFIVIATSIQGFKNWKGSLTQYLTSNSIQDFGSFGAGDLLVMLLAAAISSLAFSTVDAIMQFHRLMSLIIPTLLICCVVIVIQAAFLSWILQTPSETGLPLLIRTVTTPVAVAIAEIIGASSSITASSTIINGITSYIFAPYVLNFYGVLNPVSRGCAAAVSGTLLGVLAMDEKGEKVAAGIGIAAYGLATILYALIMGIDPFQTFVVDLQ